MEATTLSEDVTLSLPNTDLSFLRTLSKKMGWTMKRHRKSGIEKGLEDIRKGNVYHAKDAEDLIKQILGQMKYEVIYTGQFKKSLRLCVRRGLNIDDFTIVLNILQSEGKLPPKYHPHRLQGKYKGCWECHINPDWFLIQEQDDRQLYLVLVDTGSHSDLF